MASLFPQETLERIQSGFIVYIISPKLAKDTLFLCVTTNLGCQLDYIWNRLKPKQLGMRVGDLFLLDYSKGEGV